MIIVDKKLIPQEILKDSVLVHLASAYFAIGKRLEQKTKCSQTRGFIMSTLRGGAALNQNQIATMLGFDRTVVHRAIKTMIHEGLLSERKADTGRALPVQLTAKGNKYREGLVKERRAAEDKLRKELTAGEASTLIRLLQRIAELELSSVLKSEPTATAARSQKTGPAATKSNPKTKSKVGGVK